MLEGGLTLLVKKKEVKFVILLSVPSLISWWVDIKLVAAQQAGHSAHFHCF